MGLRLAIHAQYRRSADCPVARLGYINHFWTSLSSRADNGRGEIHGRL